MTLKVILGEHQITRTESPDGIATVSGCGAVAYCITKFWGYGAIAPYPQSGGNRVTRALQRAVIDKSKTPIGTRFYPLDSLRTVTPKRANARLIGMGHKDPQYTSMIVQNVPRNGRRQRNRARRNRRRGRGTGKKVVSPISPIVYKPAMPRVHWPIRDPTIPLADATCDRVEGYLCTDALTPLISDYCKMVLRLYGPTASTAVVRNQRRSRNKKKPYWLTCDGSWPQHPQDDHLMKQVLTKRAGINEDQVDALIGRFAAMKDVWEKITHDSEESAAACTFDEDGAMPGSVDESLPKLNDAKQTRANPGTSRPHSNGGGSSNGNELSGRTEQRAQGPRQPACLLKQGKANGGTNGDITAGETQRGGIPRGKGPRGGKTNTRRTPPKAGAQPQPSNNRK